MNPVTVQETATLAQQAAGCAAIDAYQIAMQQAGLKESTIRPRIKVLKGIAKPANILNPSDVTAFLVNVNWQDNTKQKRVEDLAAFYAFKGIDWNKPKCRRIGKLPQVPLETDSDQLIQTVQLMRRGKKAAVFLQLLKETGARPGEAWALEWLDVDLERALVNIAPEKGSNPRQLRISQKLITMLSTLNRSSQFIFQTSSGNPLQSLENFRRTFEDQRTRAALELDNPRIKQITFRSLRHFKATTEYHKTKDILHVMRILGHKNIKNTLVYTHLVGYGADEWVCKVAATVDEAKLLIEQGFEFVTDIEGMKLFRKRK